MLSSLNNLFFSIRPLNLFIVGLTQSYFLFKLIYPSLIKLGIEPRLDNIHAILFCGVTLIISASGYLINDYYDYEIDLHNQVKKSKLSKKNLLSWYIGFVVIGGIFALYISYTIDKWNLFLIYPFVIILLYWYSKQLKYYGLAGNIIVAGFTAFVTLILFVAEPVLLHSKEIVIREAAEILIAFSIFSFLSNLIREIIKDIEDREGDKIKHSRSIPITLGIKKTKILLNFLILVLIVLLTYWTFTFDVNNFRSIIFNCIFLLAPLVLSFLRLYHAITKLDFHHLSTFYKWVMISGLISLVITNSNT